MALRQIEYRTKCERGHTAVFRLAYCLSLAVWLAMNQGA